MAYHRLVYRPVRGPYRFATVRASSREAAIRKLARETGWREYLIAPTAS